ncbi:MAG: hypothetical protein K5829_15015 [Treponema sp.]|nr:hypothetical protein [Treponema sp.]
MEDTLKRYSILCGDAPEGFSQKKINEMHSFLTSEAGGNWSETEIMIFPNGVNEMMLSYVLNNLKTDSVQYIFVYLCMTEKTSDIADFIFLGDNKIAKSFIESVDGVQVIYDYSHDFMSDDELFDNNCDELLVPSFISTGKIGG